MIMLTIRVNEAPTAEHSTVHSGKPNAAPQLSFLPKTFSTSVSAPAIYISETSPAMTTDCVIRVAGIFSTLAPAATGANGGKAGGGADGGAGGGAGGAGGDGGDGGGDGGATDQQRHLWV